MADNKLYKEDSIESLSPLEFTRLRPGVYAGDTTYSTQLLVEIVSNAVDEFRLGHGDRIDVIIEGDIIQVRDYGQGFIPNSFREDGKSILEAAFSVLNTSGKYREDGTYEGTSLGSFGIGSKITTFLSHWLEVSTFRDGQCEAIRFYEGVFEKRWQLKNIKTTGTKVVWQPSEEFFTHTEVEIEKIKSLFKTIVCLCPGLTISLKHNGNEIIFFSQNGLDDLVDDAVNNKEIINNRFSMKFSEGKEKMDMVLTYTSNYSSTLVPYVNTGLTEKGPHITQVKTVLTREFNKFFREKKWLKEKEENLTGEDIQEGMYIVFNITAPNISYDAQVKSTVTKIEMTRFTQALADNLQYWFSNNEKEVKVIADKALAARKAREAAKKAREAARDDKKKKKEKLIIRDSKLADCSSTNRAECEIFLTEGDSASGNLKMARNKKTQAVMPLRGKVLNVQKASLEKIKGNAEIVNIIDSLGLEIDTKTMLLTFNKDRLRYGKIILMADADDDGYHIQTLLLTLFWNFCRELILDGYVYIGVPPLYTITEGKDKISYCKDDAELEAFKNSHKGKKYTVKHLKGLGEMSAEDTDILVNPDRRTLIQVTVGNIEECTKLFDDLMGTNVEPRKKFIESYEGK